MKIIAIVVTYNRIKLLQKCIECIKGQTYPINKIIIINNGSTDGSKEWLDRQKDIEVIHQQNVGGSGGFYTGLKIAYEEGADWIWAMDDDVNPTKSCLEILINNIRPEIGILCPSRYINDKLILGETYSFNLSNPFKNLKRPLTTSIISSYNNSIIEIQGMAFEGPLISKNVIETIGLPNKDLFIFWDDSDFSYRAYLKGFKICYIKHAILNKENLSQPSQIERTWKVPYSLRNEVYFCHTYAQNSFFKKLYTTKILLRYIIGFFKHKMKQDHYYKKNDLQMIFQSYHDGIKKKLGKYE